MEEHEKMVRTADEPGMRRLVMIAQMIRAAVIRVSEPDAITERAEVTRMRENARAGIRKSRQIRLFRDDNTRGARAAGDRVGGGGSAALFLPARK